MQFELDSDMLSTNLPTAEYSMGVFFLFHVKQFYPYFCIFISLRIPVKTFGVNQNFFLITVTLKIIYTGPFYLGNLL